MARDRDTGRQEVKATTRYVLIVDDDESVGLAFCYALEKLPGCQVVAVASGQQAVRLLERRSFDLLITDYKMAGLDGLALASHVRQRYPATAIVMITGRNSEELCQQASARGVRCVLDKPVSVAAIRAAASAILRLEERRSEGDGHGIALSR